MTEPNESMNEVRSGATGESAGSGGGGWKLLAGVGIGAAIMYFLDPDRGARRRAMVADQANSLAGKATRELHDRGEDVRNRLRGKSHEIRHRGDDMPEDDVLIARVRAELGHHVEHAKAIEVVAENGTVTLSGPVLREEIDGVISTVRGVRGVRDVNNALFVHESPEGVPALQDGSPGGETT